MRFTGLFLWLILFSSCQVSVVRKCGFLNQLFYLQAKNKSNDHSWLVPFGREEIENNLATKISNNIPLIVHCLVPLCDNQFQGIVPTTASLGNGFSLTSNLYWATRNGMKRYFSLSTNWSTMQANFIPDDTILERVAFERIFKNGAKVILICDAYRGDQMESCVLDYFSYLAGKKADSLNFGGSFLKIGSEADMIVFNGHNGLMDVQIDPIYASKKRFKDAVVIACSSKWNYIEHITYANSYPLITTTGSLYPGATILNAIIENWALLKESDSIRLSAGLAYDELKNCGAESANNLFYCGW